MRILWIPVSYFTKFSEPEDHEAQNYFATHFSVSGIFDMDLEHSDRFLILHSMSVSKEQLEIIKEQFVRTWMGDHEKIRSRILIKDSLFEYLDQLLQDYEVNNYGDQDLHIVDGRSVEKIRTPKPLNFDVDPKNIRWLCETHCKNFLLPATNAFNECVIWPNPGAVSKDFRSARNGFVFTANSHMYQPGLTQDLMLLKPYLEVFPAFTLFEMLFESKGFHIQLSDKGHFQLKSQELFDSQNQFFEFFAESNNRALLDKFLDAGLKGGTDQKRRYLKLADFTAVYGEDVTKQIDFLIQHSIIQRGMVLKCSHCRNASFYLPGEISTDFKCKRCNAKHIIDSYAGLSKIEPEWHYSLNEVVFQGYQNNMIVPILTLKKLSESSQGTFIQIPEIELRKDLLSEKPDYESDICCILDGRLIIGECKINGEITQEEIKKYETISKQSNADRIVFGAVKENFKPGSLQRIKKLETDLSQSLISIHIIEQPL